MNDVYFMLFVVIMIPISIVSLAALYLGIRLYRTYRKGGEKIWHN